MHESGDEDAGGTSNWTKGPAHRPGPSVRPELPVPILERAPQVPARDGAMRAPLCADLAHVLWSGTLPLAIRPTDRVLNPQVQLGQHIWPAQSEHQEHLRRPPADAFHLHEVLDQVVVAHLVDGIERKLARRDLGREITKIGDLLPRQSDCSKLLVARCENGVGLRGSAVERIEARENRPSRLAGQLLVDDRAHERLVMSALGPQLNAARTDSLDYLCEDRIDALEVSDGCAVVCHPVNLRAPRVRRAARVSSFLR